MLKRGFNTSHVTLYLPASHPLKLFLRRFNTSHVTLYHRPAFQKRCGFLVSIHLMLLFIGHAQIQNAFNILFQYISCYSLSQKRFSLSCFCTGFQYISCYSLSEIPRGQVIATPVFQYISCYSLSLSQGRVIKRITRFQYISCYSLSTTIRTMRNRRSKFQYISCYSLSESRASNICFIQVSIHLMLLFISHI